MGSRRLQPRLPCFPLLVRPVSLNVRNKLSPLSHRYRGCLGRLGRLGRLGPHTLIDVYDNY